MVAHKLDIAQLPRALAWYGKSAEQMVIRAMRKSAVFGKTAAVRTYTQTKDPFRIRASGSYGNNWIHDRIPDGGLVANAIFYAVFVERGRRPGKMPPDKPIREWVYQKRLAKRARAKKEGKPKPKETPVPASREWEKPLPATPGQETAKRLAWIKSARRPKKKRKKKVWKVKNVDSFVWLVRRKIARKGTKGRWVLRRSMPQIAGHSAKQVKRELAKLSRMPPRTSEVKA